MITKADLDRFIAEETFTEGREWDDLLLDNGISPDIVDTMQGLASSLMVEISEAPGREANKLITTWLTSSFLLGVKLSREFEGGDIDELEQQYNLPSIEGE